jgi:hypothetical protein
MHRWGTILEREHQNKSERTIQGNVIDMPSVLLYPTVFICNNIYIHYMYPNICTLLKHVFCLREKMERTSHSLQSIAIEHIDE